MIITKELCIDLYEFLQIKDDIKKSEYLDKISAKLNISIDNLIEQIKEINSKKLFLEKKDKDLNLSEDSIETLFSLFLDNYKSFSKLIFFFELSRCNEEDLSRIKTIELKDYYISCASDNLRLYKKEECNELNYFFYYYNKGKNINLYDMKIKYVQDENYINDILEIAHNEIIVLFINLMFLFKIENDDFKMINYTQERYKLVKCKKYNEKQIIVGSEGYILVYEKKYNYSFQKIAIYNLNNKYRKNYYFFNKIIMVNTYESIELFFIDKKFRLTKIKKDYIIPKYTRIKVCYMKKINMFVLLKNTLGKQSLILTDFENIYDEIMAPLYACNIQEYSKTDEFLLLFLEYFGKYKIENNKIKIVFLVKIKCNNNFKDFIHIKQISDDKYFITGMNGYLIYRYDKNDEKDLIDEEN